MFQNKMGLGKPARWVARALETSGDLMALVGGVIGLALIAGVILIGLHERQASVRSMSPAEYAQGATYH